MIHIDGQSAGISWPAVIGGAFVTTALSLTLLSLGAGLGLSAISPWTNSGASASAIGAAAIIWLITTQVISSSMGGYLTGRLRERWVTIHANEVYFRDTAHGFLVWAVAIVVTASFLASAGAIMVGGNTQTGVISQGTGPGLDPAAYFVDTLFRSNEPLPGQRDALLHAEVGLILANSMRQKAISPADMTYVTQLIAANTGITKVEAESRLSEVFVRAQATAETMRKAGSYVLLWLFIALLCGAFCASYAATLGGKQRDNIEAVLHDFKN